MSSRIKKLPLHIANQIAAGEVVERPASVLKELLENSIDANSRNITVYIKNGGMSLIKVIDDGKGILKEDLNLAITQHATSKISTEKDLEAIFSLGFRGEALASIASVCKFSITSKPENQTNAWKLIKDSNLGYNLEPSAHNNGTTIQMQDLFYNVPARKHFLKSEKTEYYHIEEVFKRVALANYKVGFKLYNNNKMIYNLSAINSEEDNIIRVAKIFGRSFSFNSQSVKKNYNGLNLYGWIQTPDSCKTQAMQQYFYINNRVIKDKLISHAIKKSYLQVIGDMGKNPNYCLYLELDPREIDVNVHPTKHEVRFKSSRLVHDFLFNSILDSLSALNDDTYTDEDIKLKSTFDNNFASNYSSAVNDREPQESYDNKNKEEATIMEPVGINCNVKAIDAFNIQIAPPLQQSIVNKNNKKHNLDTKSYEITRPKKISASINVLHIFDSKFAFVLVNELPVFIDLLKFFEKIFLEELQKDLKLKGKLSSKNIIFPKAIKLDNVCINTNAMDTLGFDIDEAVNSSYIVRKSPDILSNFNFDMQVCINDIAKLVKDINLTENHFILPAIAKTFATCISVNKERLVTCLTSYPGFVQLFKEKDLNDKSISNNKNLFKVIETKTISAFFK